MKKFDKKNGLGDAAPLVDRLLDPDGRKDVARQLDGRVNVRHFVPLGEAHKRRRS